MDCLRSRSWFNGIKPGASVLGVVYFVYQDAVLDGQEEQTIDTYVELMDRELFILST